jgi:hypothetical protein
MTAEEQASLVRDLLEPTPRTAVVPAVRAALGLSEKQADHRPGVHVHHVPQIDAADRLSRPVAITDAPIVIAANGC